MATPLKAIPSGPIKGQISVPGDKSISHRALIFGAMASGVTEVTGLLEADDVLRTAAAMRMLGARVERDGAGWLVEGTKWQSPARVIYCGNSGTGVRLIMGAVAGQGVSATFDGDRSLRGRPMDRILDPLTEMGMTSLSIAGRLPLTVHAGKPKAITYELPKASAQIKSAVLLAALGAEGITHVIEPELSRDHTERMLPAFGVDLSFEEKERGRIIRLEGPAKLSATSLSVPADPSSAAFPLVTAALIPGSELTVKGVMTNPLRTGLYQTLLEMGADLTFSKEKSSGGEETADLTMKASSLTGVTVPADRVPSMVDEYPILAVAAAFAKGTTRMEGLTELRVKESDRLAATADLLIANGVTVRTGDDWLEVDGMCAVPGGGTVITHDDHRIAMSGLVLGLASRKPVTVDDGEMINTSFTGFANLMASIGGQIAAA